MKRAKTILPLFLLLLFLSLILFFFQAPLTKLLQTVTVPLQRFTFGIVTAPTAEMTTPEQLQKENKALRVQLAKLREIEKDNKALRDQFNLTDQNPTHLVPADVIGMRDDTLIISKGTENGLALGDIVVLKDNLVGKVTKLSPYLAVVTLISHPSTSFTAQTVKTQTIGVIKSQGGDNITLDNVVLADTLEKRDLIMTKGDIDEKGRGFPPQLIVGEIISVNKKASNLFQKAQVRSLVDFGKIRTVFVKIKN